MNAQGNPAEYKPHSNPRICKSKKSVNRRPRCSLHRSHHSKYIVLAVDFHLPVQQIHLCMESMQGM